MAATFPRRATERSAAGLAPARRWRPRRRRPRRGTLLASLLTVCLVSAASASSSSAHSSSTHRLEAERYAPLPPTVFSPSGRLHNVESAAQKAGDAEDWCGSTVVALRCRRRLVDDDEEEEEEGGSDEVSEKKKKGGGKRGWEEFVAVVSAGPRSPLAYYVDGTEEDDDNDDDSDEPKHREAETDDSDSDDGFRAPLLLPSHASSTSSLARSPPLSILSPTLVVAAAGRAADSAVFLRRLQDAALSIYRSEDGGVASHPFASHGVRSMSGLEEVVRADDLARRVADAIQIPTQTMGGSAGGTIASSALIIGAAVDNKGRNNGKGGLRCRYRVWRLDPTGQFWDCDAAAIGRGAGIAEAALMRRAAEWKAERSSNEDEDSITVPSSSDSIAEDEDPPEMGEILESLTNDDVRDYLGSLSVDEALEVAYRALMDARSRGEEEDDTNKKGRKLINNGKEEDEEDDDETKMVGARYYGIQGLVLRPSAAVAASASKAARRTVSVGGGVKTRSPPTKSSFSSSSPRAEVLSWDDLRGRVEGATAARRRSE